MTDQHPITPPPELLQQWATEYWGTPDEYIGNVEKYIANQAARWGADQELEACCKLLGGCTVIPVDGYANTAQNRLAAVDRVARLRAARRPRPPSLAEEALNELDLVPTHDQDGRSIDADTSVIRRALEQLKELENNG